jgi:hypothetical protein
LLSAQNPEHPELFESSNANTTGSSVLRKTTCRKQQQYPMHPNLEKLRKLESGTPVRFRLGLHGRNAPDWEPWQTANLYIAKREKDLPAKYRKNMGSDKSWQAGAVITLTPEEGVHAEYCERSFDPDSCTFSAEEYCLEIDFNWVP